jgi:hypothetical protein
MHQSSERKTGENIFKYIKEEIEHLQSLGVKVIGVAGDAGGDERKGRRLTVKEFPFLLAADCWGHQVSDRLSEGRSWPLRTWVRTGPQREVRGSGPEHG